MKFSIKETTDLVTFTEEIMNGKLCFYAVSDKQKSVLKTLKCFAKHCKKFK